MPEISTNNAIFDTSPVVVDEEIEAMMKAGVHVGHAKSKTHPAMQPYIFGIRNTTAIIDLVKTKEKLAEAVSIITRIVERGGMVLFVGTRPSARRIMSEVWNRVQMPVYDERWIGGTLTNFKEISRRIMEMETLEREKAAGDWGKYTKKEQIEKDKDLSRLKRMFNGVRALKRAPDAVFVVDINEDEIAIRETKRLNIPVIALSDTNSDPRLVDHPIPSNDDALSSLRYMFGRIADAVEEGRKRGALKRTEETK